jgi:ribosomal protein S18 acetylase RimI-like enzyme
MSHFERLQNDQIEAASRVAARALQNDPLSAYYYPDPIERKIKTVIKIEYLILLGILSGEVYTTSSDIQVVAVWNTYGIKDQTIGKQSKEIIRKLRKVKRKMFSDRLFSEKYIITSEIYNSLHNEHANFPHWGFTMLTVDPLHQGKGYASMLIKPKLLEIDKQNLPCYLNTQNENNLSLYEHFGFELVGEKKVHNFNVNYYGMLRNKKKS